MKVKNWYIIGAMAMTLMTVTGCSSDYISTHFKEKFLVEGFKVDDTQLEINDEYSTVNESFVQKLSKLETLAQQENQGSVNITYGSSFYNNVERKELEFLQEDGDVQEILNLEIIDYLEAEVLPGIKGFLEEMSTLEPKATVINNSIIACYPAESSNHGGRNSWGQVKVIFRVDKLIDPFYGKLTSAVNHEQFVIGQPIVGGQKQGIEISTPAYIERLGYWDYDDITGENQYYFSKPSISYQLFVAEEALDKIRVIVRKYEAEETIDTDYFEALEIWLQDEWQAGQEDLETLDMLIQKCATGDVQPLKGDTATYTYKYQTLVEDMYRGENEIMVDLVLEKK